jgi:hypothetical protein
MIKLLTKKEIVTKIANAQKSAHDLQPELHAIAVQCLLHHYKHGDSTLANKFVAGLPKSIRKADLYRWFIAFGALDYDIKNGLTHNAEKLKAVTDVEKQVENANATPFYELNKDKEVVKKDFLSILKELEKKISYDLDKHKAPRFSVNDLADIRKLIKARESKQA